MTERYILVTDDEYCYTLDSEAEGFKTLEDFEKAEFKQAKKDGEDINDYEAEILISAYDKYWDWVYNAHLEADTVNDLLNLSYDEIKVLKEQLNDIKQDEHQLSLSFLEYKQKVQKTLQKHYDKRIGNDILLEELAEELGVELE